MSAPRGDDHPNAKVTDRRIQQMKKMRAQGWQVREIAREFGVHECSVSRYLHDRGRVGQAERAAALSAHTTEGDPT